MAGNFRSACAVFIGVSCGVVYVIELGFIFYLVIDAFLYTPARGSITQQKCSGCQNNTECQNEIDCSSLWKAITILSIVIWIEGVILATVASQLKKNASNDPRWVRGLVSFILPLIKIVVFLAGWIVILLAIGVSGLAVISQIVAGGFVLPIVAFYEEILKFLTEEQVLERRDNPIQAPTGPTGCFV